MSIESAIPSNHLIPCHLLLPSVFPSIRVFSSESALRTRWPNYWSFSVLSVNIQGWFPSGLTVLISLLSQGLSRVFSNTTVQKHQFFSAHLSLWSNSSHLYITTGKNIALTRWTFVSKVLSLLLNMLFTLVIVFLPRSKLLLISWLQSPSKFILIQVQGHLMEKQGTDSLLLRSVVERIHLRMIWKVPVCRIIDPTWNILIEIL